MLQAGFWSIHASRGWRTAYLVCLPFILSYILFDALDLDGSNFSRLLAPVERPVAVAELTFAPEVVDSYEPAAPWAYISHSFLDRSERSNLSRQARALGFLELDSARSHGYRVGLARNSLSDSSPYV